MCSHEYNDMTVQTLGMLTQIELFSRPDVFPKSLERDPTSLQGEGKWAYNPYISGYFVNLISLVSDVLFT